MKTKNCIIKAMDRHSDYVMKAMIEQGNTVYIPYRDYNLFFRCAREVWFRLKFPGRKWWFNPKLKKLDVEEVRICDPLIIKPTDVVRPNLKYASYDLDDCNQYGMQFNHACYMRQYCFTPEEKLPPEYDVIYLGRDKGRAETILALQKKIESMGLKTYFHICADRAYMRHKKQFYKPRIPYEDYVELLKRTRAHLNIVQEGQTSITQRDLESVCDQVKCITNNQGIKSFELYDPSRFFVLGVDDIETLPEFLDTPFKAIPDDKLDEYR